MRASGLSYAIVRPTLLFGHGDVLINNISWFLRHLPVFGIPGDGGYRLQPVFVEDYADVVADAGFSTDNVVRDAAGPEIFTFEELVGMLREAMELHTSLIHLPPALALAGTRLVGLMVRDMVLTGAEIRGLMAELLVSGERPACSTRLSEWARAHQAELGRRYASELDRHYRRAVAGAQGR